MLNFIQEELYNNLGSRVSPYSTVTKDVLVFYHSQNFIKTTINKLYVSPKKEKPSYMLVCLQDASADKETCKNSLVMDITTIQHLFPNMVLLENLQ